VTETQGEGRWHKFDTINKDVDGKLHDIVHRKFYGT